METLKLPTNSYYIKNIYHMNNLLKIQFFNKVDLSNEDLSYMEVYTSGGKLCTSFEGYTTIYQEKENNIVILSNDGSVYKEPEVIPDNPIEDNLEENEPTEEELLQQLEIAKNIKIKESHELLEKYLSEHPLLYTDGNYYSVTLEKQSLLTGNLLAYQLELQHGVSNPELEWNASGEECVPWTFEELSALAIAIKYYVKPFVAYQRKLEKDVIKTCASIEELNNVVIDYENAKIDI